MKRKGVKSIYRDVPDTLLHLIEPVVVDHDCELVDVEVAQNRGKGLLRITVDSLIGDGRVPVERCAAISREVETSLDAADAMSGAYQLEVSSPGLDRVLGRVKDFESVIGQEIKLRTRRPIEGRKRYRGKLRSIEASPDDEGMVLEVLVDGVAAKIPFEDVEKANAIYEFTSEDFSKKKSQT